MRTNPHVCLPGQESSGDIRALPRGCHPRLRRVNCHSPTTNSPISQLTTSTLTTESKRDIEVSSQTEIRRTRPLTILMDAVLRIRCRLSHAQHRRGGLNINCRVYSGSLSEQIVLRGSQIGSKTNSDCSTGGDFRTGLPRLRGKAIHKESNGNRPDGRSSPVWNMLKWVYPEVEDSTANSENKSQDTGPLKVGPVWPIRWRTHPEKVTLGRHN